MKKNKYLYKFNKITLFLSLLILVLLYILYIHNTNYENLFENFSLIANDFVNPCDKGYPHFYLTRGGEIKEGASEISCNLLCDMCDNCSFYTISGNVCYTYNSSSLNDISVNCNEKYTVLSTIGPDYKGIGFIKNVNNISLLKYHDNHLYNVNNLLNNKETIDTELRNIYMQSISDEYITTISGNMLGGNDDIDNWGYMNISGVKFFKDKYLHFINNSFDKYLDDLSLNRGYNGWSYVTGVSNGYIPDTYPNPIRMINQKQNTKNIEQTNKDLENYTKKKTQFVYMFLLILVILTASILILYFIIPNIVTDLILIIYFIGIFSILFYLKGYL